MLIFHKIITCLKSKKYEKGESLAKAISVLSDEIKTATLEDINNISPAGLQQTSDKLA